MPSRQSKSHSMSPRSVPKSSTSLPWNSGAAQTTYQRKWMQDKEDLNELEKMMVPEDMRSKYRTRSILNGQFLQPVNNVKMSKFTTGFLTDSGWQSIKNDYWDELDISIDSDRKWAPTNVNAKVALVTDFGLDHDLKETENNDDEGPPTLFLDEKYFDHDGYLAYRSGKKYRKQKASTSRASKKVKEKGTEKQPQAVVEVMHIDDSKIIPNTAKAHADKSVVDIVDEEIDALAEDQTGKWELLEGDTISPRIGTPAPEKLTILLRNIETQAIHTYNFRKIPREDIDWGNKTQIQEISKWRWQILRRRGFSLRVKKANVLYTRDEDAWLILFHKKLKAVVEAGHAVKMPGPIPIMEAFNTFFEGKVLKGEFGNLLPPRQARDETSLRGKLSNKSSTIWKLRDVTRKLREGKPSGELYVPVITEDELRRFREDGAFTTDDPDDISKNAALEGEAGKARRDVAQRSENATRKKEASKTTSV